MSLLDPTSSAPSALSQRLAALSLADRLREVRDVVSGRIVFTTSFGLEDQALTHALVQSGIEVAYATLDTGRLFDETLELWAETEFRYGISIKGFTAEGPSTEALLARHGPLGFRQSVEARKACCEVRKVEPLGRALDAAAGWLTGLRGDQSANRAATGFLDFDGQRRLWKISPLADWTRERVADFVLAEGVPYNPLHDQGYLSIGCAPCTRPVRIGEPERAGRWWWEAQSKKECGLHTGSEANAVTLPAWPSRAPNE